MATLRGRRGIVLLVLGLAVALALVLLASESGSNSKSVARPAAKTRIDTGTDVASSPPGYARLQVALARGVDAAATLGGQVEAAAMLDDWSRPALASSEADGAEREMRLWSMSKVPTMIALLRGLGWGERAGKPTSPEVDEALQGAITRSENCHQRRVVLELEHVAGGSAGARAALAAVFRLAGAHAEVAEQTEAPEANCLAYLRGQSEIADPLAPALLLGTSHWRVQGAVRLAHALAVETFGAAISRRVLALMREPKLPSREVPVGELTAPLNWGAGNAFAGFDPAYKAGWGGSLNGNFLAGQIAVVGLPGGDHLAVAAMFHPDTQPSRDDPGITAAPRALELIMDSLRQEVESSGRRSH